jgi:FixJ family two-component response regulator
VSLREPDKVFIDDLGVPMNVQGSRIAVIDDDLRVLESLGNLLRSFGYSVEGYQSAEQFLTSGALSRTSRIITDVEMRQMSGLGLLEYCKRDVGAVLTGWL